MESIADSRRHRANEAMASSWAVSAEPISRIARNVEAHPLTPTRILVIMDAALAAAGFALGCLLRYLWNVGGIHDAIVPVSPLRLAQFGLIAVVLTLGSLAQRGAYRPRFSEAGLSSYLSVAYAATIAMAVVIIAATSLQEREIARLAFAYAWLLMIGAMLVGRLARETVLARAYRQGRGLRRVLIVGATPAGKMVMQNLATRLSKGYRLVGFLDDGADGLRRFGRFAGLGRVSDLDRILLEYEIDEVVIALRSTSHARIAGIFAQCEQANVAVKFLPDLFDLRLSRVHMDDVAGIPLIDVRAGDVDRLHVLSKRALDIALGSFMLIVALPIMCLTALAIKLASPGPVLFRQERLGKNGRPFTILKFRSMRADAERQLELLRTSNEATGPIFKMRNDPRVTSVGRFIRKFSIDELPQLWNVLRGDMSLVGPRPPLAKEVAQYSDWHRRRLEATPGITCLWGVSGRSTLDFDEMVMLDVYYIENWSLGLDLRILLRTAITVLSPRGAY